MKIAITGSTGLVGTETVNHFKSQGHEVTRLVRPETNYEGSDLCLEWDAENGVKRLEYLDGHNVVIHLAGANLANERWSAKYKDELYASRVNATSALCHSLAQLRNPPKVVFSASAVGYYGHRAPDKSIDEAGARGKDFLAELCYRWEEATDPAKKAGIRVVNLRMGMVLSRHGGALAKMLPVFQKGLGGKLGSGEQMISWITIDEIPAVIDFLIGKENILGPVNVVSPNPVSNADFTKMLGNALGKPATLPVPAFGVRMMFGEMADILLLNGAKVLPRRLLELRYWFKYPDLEAALSHCLSA